MGFDPKEEFVEHAAIGEAFVNGLLYDDSDELYHDGRKAMEWGQHLFGKVKSGAKKVGGKVVETVKKKRAEKAAEKLRKKPLSKLTDEELEVRLKRLELEKRVADLESQIPSRDQQYMSAGKAFLKKVGTDVVAPAATNAAREVLERWLKKQGYDFTGLKDEKYGVMKGWKEAQEALLEKEKLSNKKQAETLKDELNKINEKREREAAEDRVDKEIEDNIRKAEKKAKKSAAKAERAAQREAKKVYTGEVSGEGTSKRKTEQPKSKPSDYYNPIETEFVNNTVSAASRSDEYRRGKALVGQLLLNP